MPFYLPILERLAAGELVARISSTVRCESSAAVATSSVKQERTCSEWLHLAARRQVEWRCSSPSHQTKSVVHGLLAVCDRNTALDHLLISRSEDNRKAAWLCGTAALTGCSSGVNLPPFPEPRCISSPQLLQHQAL